MCNVRNRFQIVDDGASSLGTPTPAASTSLNTPEKAGSSINFANANANASANDDSDDEFGNAKRPVHR